jgi:hypothetical protein
VLVLEADPRAAWQTSLTDAIWRAGSGGCLFKQFISSVPTTYRESVFACAPFRSTGINHSEFIARHDKFKFRLSIGPDTCFAHFNSPFQGERM